MRPTTARTREGRARVRIHWRCSQRDTAAVVLLGVAGRVGLRIDRADAHRLIVAKRKPQHERRDRQLHQTE